jgi:hypothetical protein
MPREWRIHTFPENLFMLEIENIARAWEEKQLDVECQDKRM